MAKFKIGDRVRRIPGKLNYAGWPGGSGEVTITDYLGTGIQLSGIDKWWEEHNFVLAYRAEDENNFYVAIPNMYVASVNTFEIHGPMSLEDARKRAQAVPIGSKARIFTGVEEITAVRSFETKVLN